MAIDAVEADVQLSADEPLRIWRLPLEQLLPRLEPGDAPVGLLRPEVLELAVVDVGLGVGLLAKLGRRRIAPLLHLHRLDRVLAGLSILHSFLLHPPDRQPRPP